MRTIFLNLLLIVAAHGAFAQSYPQKVEFDKLMKPGLELQIPSNEDIVEGTILQKLKETGYDPETKGHLFWKKNKKDGFFYFNDVVLPELNNRKLDLYFKIDRRSKHDKNNSVVDMMVAKGEADFISADSDPEVFAAAKKFLDNFMGQTKTYSLNLDVKTQEKVSGDAENKLSKLKDDQANMEKKIAQLQKDLKRNAQDQEDQQKEVELQQAKLKDARGKLN